METEATVSEFQNMLSARGVSRRSFMKLCGAVAVAAGLSELAAPRVAQALEKSVIGATKGKLYPVIWIEGASCTGCTESFAQVETPDAASIVLDMISLNYSETLSAAAGWSMEEAKEQTIEAGNYILVYEGAVLADVIFLEKLPALNSEDKPAGIFDQTIHDNCERRGHFENGEFVYKFGSEEEAKGYCLYPLGCRGPQTKANCGVTMWNNRRSWCVQSGAPCIGCCEANPNDPGHNWVEVNTPVYKRHRDLRIGDWMVQPGTIALGITGILAAALVVHGFGMKITGRMDGGADFEKVRGWDAKHPDKSIGKYDEADLNNDDKKEGR